MQKIIIDNDKLEITIGIVHHITSWYFKCALLFDINVNWNTDILDNKHFGLSIDILYFRIFVEIWKWDVK